MIVKRTDLTPKQNYTWIDARNIDRDDIAVLTDEYMIPSEVLADIMDQDEQARIEKEDDYTVIICRLPSDEEDEESGLVILKVVQTDEGEELSTLDSEEELDAVYQQFMESLFDEDEES